MRQHAIASQVHHPELANACSRVKFQLRATIKVEARIRDLDQQENVRRSWMGVGVTVPWQPHERNVWLRLIGPGRVAVSSAFHHTSGLAITRNSSATVQRW